MATDKSGGRTTIDVEEASPPFKRWVRVCAAASCSAAHEKGPVLVDWGADEDCLGAQAVTEKGAGLRSRCAESQLRTTSEQLSPVKWCKSWWFFQMAAS